MSSSTLENITPIMRMVMGIKPKSILDIGVGFGKWGHLCREYLDAWECRVDKDKWQVQINGIEIFRDNIQLHQKHIYDHIFIGDASFLASLTEEEVTPYTLDCPYDLVLANDVIEHIEKEKALALFDELQARTAKHIICSIPIGKGWLGRPPSVTKVNPHEDHISSWEVEEMLAMGFTVIHKVHHTRGPIVTFYWKAQ